MRITPHEYYDGRVRSIWQEGDVGIPIRSVGMLLPGRYDFGEATRKETETIIFGALRINGKWFYPGDVCVIQPGECIDVFCAEPSAFDCIFG